MGFEGYRPFPQYEPGDPLEQAMRFTQLQSLAGGQQLQQQEIAGRDIQNQQGQQQLTDQRALTAGMQEWDGKNLDDLPGIVLKHGGSATAVLGLRNSIVDQKQKLASLDKDTLANQSAKNDQLLGKLQAASDPSIPDGQLPDAVNSAAQEALQQGLIDPQHMQMVQNLVKLPPDQLRSQLGLFEKSLMGQKAQFEQANQAKETQAKVTQAKYKESNGVLYDVSGDKPTPAIGGNMQPADWNGLVDSIVPPGGSNSALNARTKAQVNFSIQRGDVAGAQKAISEAGQQIGAVEKETNPAVIGARVGQAVATELGTAKALAPQLQQITNTTRGGRQYINREDIPQKSQAYVEQQAASAGVPVVDKDTAGTLSDIDTAKANQDFMLNQISSKLASDATGRLYKAPANTIEKLAQTDPTLAAVGTYRNAAIQSMRAVAGSKGLRINQYEVQLAIDNDIPKMTDTLPVAQQKLTNLKAFLDNTEQSHLVRNRQAGGNSVGQSNSGGPPTPSTHTFSKGAWMRANPKGDVAAAVSAAKAQNYTVTE